MFKITAAFAAVILIEEIDQCGAQYRGKGCLRRVADGRTDVCAMGNKDDKRIQHQTAS
jgi:hypothetical protein